MCVFVCVLPAVVTVLTFVWFLLTVSSAVSEQRAAVYRSIRTLSTPVRLLTWTHRHTHSQLLWSEFMTCVFSAVWFLSGVCSQVCALPVFVYYLCVSSGVAAVRPSVCCCRNSVDR